MVLTVFRITIQTDDRSTVAGIAESFTAERVKIRHADGVLFVPIREIETMSMNEN
ncbi:hypothetical protein [Brevibacillus reuszeri]|uniref:hypothetical protein n=1 Tax=Brevibacillus reuszeri TaxID=54915 RepID=UPI000AB3BA17|nr:hypothetical protein [Brevibacillus reuszeri]MED1861633.1 hypothetical protein [Brevibacillus reuszeri]